MRNVCKELTSLRVEYPPELPERLLEAPDVMREHDDVLLLDDVALGRALAAAHRVHGERAGVARAFGGLHPGHAAHGVGLVGRTALSTTTKRM